MAWFVAFIGSIAGFLFGYDEGIIAGSLSLLRSHFLLEETSVGVMTSALPFGALLGSVLIGILLASRFVKRFARRPILAFAGFLFLLGAMGTAVAQALWVLVYARFVLGIAIGIAAVMTPLYLAETAHERLRGAIVAIYQLAMTFGIVCAYMVNYLLMNQGAWRMMFASSAIPSFILIAGLFFLPESPRWLVSQGRYMEAEKALRRLRGHELIQQELHHIETTLSREPEQGHWRALFKKPLRSVLFLGMMLFCLQQLSGINVIIYFAPEIFKSLGFENLTGQILATIGIGLVNLLVTVLAIFYIDKIGRRKLLLFGFVGTFLSLLILCFFSLQQVSFLPYLSVCCLTAYIFSFAISIGPVPHVVMAEIFPLYVRGAGMALSSMSNWGFNTLVIFSFPLLHASIGMEYTFAIYALICFFGFIYTWIYMPETKNLSLEDIEDYLVSGQPLSQLGRQSRTLDWIPASIEEKVLLD